MHGFIKKKHHHNYFSAISYSKIRKILDYMVKLCYNSIRDFVSNFCHALKTVKTYMLRMFIRPATIWIFSVSSELSNQTPQQEKEGAYAEYISCPRTGRSYWANIFEFDLTLLKRKVSS